MSPKSSIVKSSQNYNRTESPLTLIILKQSRRKHTMNLQKVHHIAIIGSDYEKSKHFYVDLLGFSVIRENRMSLGMLA